MVKCLLCEKKKKWVQKIFHYIVYKKRNKENST